MLKMFAVVLLSVAAAAGFAQSAGPGVYLQQGSGWEKMYLATTSGSKAKGFAKEAFSYGIASGKVVMLYRDRSAQIATEVPRPVFRIAGGTAINPRDIVIVRLEQKKDHRELQVASSRAFSGVNLQYPERDTIGVNATEHDSDLLLVPKADLRPGEYILFASSPTPMPSGAGGYDFTVDGAR